MTARTRSKRSSSSTKRPCLRSERWRSLVAMEAIYPNQLASEREAAGLTREELAQRADVELRLYVELEEGRMLPTYDELELIRAQLGGIEPPKLYATSLVNSISDERYWQDRADYKRFY